MNGKPTREIVADMAFGPPLPLLVEIIAPSQTRRDVPQRNAVGAGSAASGSPRAGRHDRAGPRGAPGAAAQARDIPASRGPSSLHDPSPAIGSRGSTPRRAAG